MYVLLTCIHLHIHIYISRTHIQIHFHIQVQSFDLNVGLRASNKLLPIVDVNELMGQYLFCSNDEDSVSLLNKLSVGFGWWCMVSE